jgi:hypothetical protein
VSATRPGWAETVAGNANARANRKGRRRTVRRREFGFMDTS